MAYNSIYNAYSLYNKVIVLMGGGVRESQSQSPPPTTITRSQSPEFWSPAPALLISTSLNTTCSLTLIVKSLLLWNVSYITTPGHAVLTSANKLEDPYIASIQFRAHIHTHVPVQAHTCVWLYLLCILSNFKQTQILNCIFKDKFRVTNQIYQGQYDLFLRINYVYSNRKQNGSHWPDFFSF